MDLTKKLKELSRQEMRLIGLFGALLVLILPALAMQFTDQVNWSLEDFAAMFLLLALLGASIEVIVRIFQKTGFRLAAGTLVCGFFVLIWAHLAVGIF